MGLPAIRTRRLSRGLQRLGFESRAGNGDHKVFRQVVTSREGTAVALNVVLDAGRREQPRGIVDLIADQLRIGEDVFLEALAKWSAETYRAHCAALSAADLSPPSMRRGAPGARPPAPRNTGGA